MSRTITIPQEVTVDVDVDVDVNEVIDELQDDELEDLGLRRISGSGEGGVENVFRAVRDWHRDHHEVPLITGCTEGVCAEINHAGAEELGSI